MNEALPGDIPFSEAADRLSTDHDVLMCYELLLGRDPENSFVIQESKTQPVRRVMEAFLRSDEFARNVAGPFRSGARMAHDSLSRGPSIEQTSWLASMLRLPENVGSAWQAARDWKTVFGPLLETLGLASGGAELSTAEVPASDALGALQHRMDQLQATLQQVNDAFPKLQAELRQLVDANQPANVRNFDKPILVQSKAKQIKRSDQS